MEPPQQSGDSGTPAAANNRCANGINACGGTVITVTSAGIAAGRLRAEAACVQPRQPNSNVSVSLALSTTSSVANENDTKVDGQKPTGITVLAADSSTPIFAQNIRAGGKPPTGKMYGQNQNHATMRLMEQSPCVQQRNPSGANCSWQTGGKGAGGGRNSQPPTPAMLMSVNGDEDMGVGQVSSTTNEPGAAGANATGGNGVAGAHWHKMNCSGGPAVPPAPNKLSDLTVAELKAECKKRGLPVSGPKPNLLERLKPYEDVVVSERKAAILTLANAVKQHNENGDGGVNAAEANRPQGGGEGCRPMALPPVESVIQDYLMQNQYTMSACERTPPAMAGGADSMANGPSTERAMSDTNTNTSSYSSPGCAANIDGATGASCVGSVRRFSAASSTSAASTIAGTGSAGTDLTMASSGAHAQFSQGENEQVGNVPMLDGHPGTGGKATYETNDAVPGALSKQVSLELLCALGASPDDDSESFNDEPVGDTNSTLSSLALHEQILRHQQSKIESIQNELRRSQEHLKRQQQLIANVKDNQVDTKQLQKFHIQLFLHYKLHQSQLQSICDTQNDLNGTHSKLKEELAVGQAVAEIMRHLRQEPRVALLIVYLLRRHRAAANALAQQRWTDDQRHDGTGNSHIEGASVHVQQQGHAEQTFASPEPVKCNVAAPQILQMSAGSYGCAAAAGCAAGDSASVPCSPLKSPGYTAASQQYGQQLQQHASVHRAYSHSGACSQASKRSLTPINNDVASFISQPCSPAKSARMTTDVKPAQPPDAVKTGKNAIDMNAIFEAVMERAAAAAESTHNDTHDNKPLSALSVLDTKDTGDNQKTPGRLVYSTSLPGRKHLAVYTSVESCSLDEESAKSSEQHQYEDSKAAAADTKACEAAALAEFDELVQSLAEQRDGADGVTENSNIEANACNLDALGDLFEQAAGSNNWTSQKQYLECTPELESGVLDTLFDTTPANGIGVTGLAGCQIGADLTSRNTAKWLDELMASTPPATLSQMHPGYSYDQMSQNPVDATKSNMEQMYDDVVDEMEEEVEDDLHTQLSGIQKKMHTDCRQEHVTTKNPLLGAPAK